MNKYKVIVEGVNFSLEIEKKTKVVGFFCALTVSSEGGQAILEDVRPLIESRIMEGRLGVENGFFLFSQVFVESVFLVNSENIALDEGGFTFYEMSFFRRVFADLKSAYFRVFSKSRLIDIKK